MSKPSIVRLLTLGDSGAGKSSLLVRYTQDEFTHEYMPTIGIDFRLKTLSVGGRTVKVQVWDTAGQERFRTITHSKWGGAGSGRARAGMAPLTLSPRAQTTTAARTGSRWCST